MVKYHIETQEAPARFLPPGKFCVIAKEEGCLGCKYCVKKACPYGVYEKAHFDNNLLRIVSSAYCRHCLFCVENCPAGLITLIVNPEYESLGDSYWTPEIITSLWRQAETGKIPVSGAGYGGPFVGKGFDDMWTDMSEIVRPTRDGIHGREYISTALEIGRKLAVLEFDNQGRLLSKVPPFIEIPLPIILQLPRWGKWSRNVLFSLAKAAKQLGTLFIMPLEDFDSTYLPYIDNLVIRLNTKEAIKALPEQTKAVEIPLDLIGEANSESFAEKVVIVRLDLEPGIEDICLKLAKQGIGVIKLMADDHGQEKEGTGFIKEAIQDIHFSLIKEGLRDQVTLIAGGGIAMAEHVAKTIICGADAVVADIAPIVALECRLCKDCTKGLPCPVEINAINSDWGKQRVVNLMASWHAQLLEVMGAMGMRDVRRLRGELGRSIPYQEVINEAFKDIKRVSAK